MRTKTPDQGTTTSRANELKAKALMWRKFGDSEHGRQQANATAQALLALTGEVLVKGQFVTVVA